MAVAKRIVAELFAALSDDPGLLPADWQTACRGPGDDRTQRVVRDYIAGMTDGFAVLEHRRIFGSDVAPRAEQP
jgi:dGTPase